VFENRVWGEYYEVTGEWRKLHNEELNDLYCSPTIVREMKWEKKDIDGACSAYRILVGKFEEKRPMRRPRLRWEDNIKGNLQEMECVVT
jgi:hypothetical protein